MSRRRSLESVERPIMAPSKRTSTNTNPRPLSTYSTTFTLSGSPAFHNYAHSTASTIVEDSDVPINPKRLSTTDGIASEDQPHPTSKPMTTQVNLETTGLREIASLTDGLKRLENKTLQQQRFVMPQRKGDEMSKLALGAKVERALGRRMKDQDAVFRLRKKSNANGHANGNVNSEKAGMKEVKA